MPDGFAASERAGGGEILNSLAVLIVEDERIIALALASMLRGLGHRVVSCVPSGEEALAALDSQRPDLVLLDIHLEGELDGIATAQAIQDRQGPPVAFTSAYTDAATQERALALGPLAFLPKPLGPHDIKNLVAELARLSG
ncbi:MAG: response regulator [Humidesulfovibrio sp.]|jgi:CheY-like chemotaxis protein|uniref:response regulator n=1 Tax=Humidesulfovibrio sp. TaxID=2910988 RepID=UPI0027328CAC|nr:response regulator [Humidesulfovibrio sp.]MDP2847054.1 response regulator [Humidesulfovibrio sp.]